MNDWKSHGHLNIFVDTGGPWSQKKEKRLRTTALNDF